MRMNSDLEKLNDKIALLEEERTRQVKALNETFRASRQNLIAARRPLERQLRQRNLETALVEGLDTIIHKVKARGHSQGIFTYYGPETETIIPRLGPCKVCVSASFGGPIKGKDNISELSILFETNTKSGRYAKGIPWRQEIQRSAGVNSIIAALEAWKKEIPGKKINDLLFQSHRR